VKAYRQASRLKPDYAEPLNNLGVLYFNAGTYQEAIGVLNRALKLNPKYAMAYYSLGLVYVEIKDKESAQSACEKLLELDAQLAHELLHAIDQI
jgi:Flp pilus assembly protein TadD